MHASRPTPSRSATPPLPSPRRLSLAVAQAMLLWLAVPAAHQAQAGVVTITGPYWMDPWSDIPLGPGDIDLAGNSLWLGAGVGAVGSFSASGGAQVRLASLQFGTGGGSATGVLDGVGTRLELHDKRGRLQIGDFGDGSLIVSGGATLDGTASPQLCLLQQNWCGAIVGATPGSHGKFTITGAGSAASFLTGVTVANTYVDKGYGVPGGTSSGRVEVLDGGWLRSEGATVGRSSLAGDGPLALGSEISEASVLIAGVGSTWSLAPAGAGGNPIFELGYGARTNAALGIVDGGSLRVARADGRYYGAIIGGGGANANATVSGNGSLLWIERGSDHAMLHIGQDGANGSLSILDGALLDGGANIHVGLNGGSGALLVNGAGSAARFDTGNYMAVGNGGRGVLEISGGGLLQTAALDVGNNRGDGTVLLSDPGSRLDIVADNARLVLAAQAGGKALMTVQNGAILNMGNSGDGYLNIGEHGDASMRVLSGGQVGGARWVGIGTDAGGSGSLLVDGAGSLFSTRWQDAQAGDVNVGGGGGGGGSLTVSNGGATASRSLQVGLGAQGRGTVSLTGAGSRSELYAVKSHRLDIESGGVTVAAGALLDGRVNAAACDGLWCGAFVGAYAGADANLIVTGAGSRASFLSDFRVGAAYVTAPPDTPYTLGVAGGTTRASVSVLDGGLLQTQSVAAGIASSGPAALGNERADVRLLVSGAGSSWQVTGSPSTLDNAYFRTGLGAGGNTHTDIRILDGALLQLGMPGAAWSQLDLAAQSGRTEMLVGGAGSRLDFAAQRSALYVGRADGQASLSFAQGGWLSGATFIEVGGKDMSTLSFDGVGSGASIAAAEHISVGRSGGNGRLSVSNGARFDAAGGNGATLWVGYNSQAGGGHGVLTIDGPGSQFLLQSTATPGSPDLPNYAPWVGIGVGAQGELRIGNGASMTVRTESTLSNQQFSPTIVNLGIGSSNGTIAGYGMASVGGAGSRLQVLGDDAVMTVGRSVGSNAQLDIVNGGRVETVNLIVGQSGASGMLNVSAATLALGGAAGNSSNGASLRLGDGAGSLGAARFGKGAVVSIVENGAGRALMTLGTRGGIGSLTMSGGASLNLAGAAGRAELQVGAAGVGSALLDASSIALGGGALSIGHDAGSSGYLKLANNSALQAAYVGVGSTPGVDGGNASLIVNDSTLTAGVLEVGSLGYLGGNGLLAAHVVNRGVINPGNSPGTLTIDGGFSSQAGGRLVLEVAGDGAGHFQTDHLLFTDGSNIDLSGLQISFHFLGATDPRAFLASGAFNIDNFLDYTGNAGLHPLDHGLYNGVSFAANADAYRFQRFSFSADGGADFSIAAVPEPGSWAMLGAGLALLGLMVRRRAANGAAPQH